MRRPGGFVVQRNRPRGFDAGQVKHHAVAGRCRERSGDRAVPQRARRPGAQPPPLRRSPAASGTRLARERIHRQLAASGRPFVGGENQERTESPVAKSSRMGRMARCCRRSARFSHLVGRCQPVPAGSSRGRSSLRKPRRAGACPCRLARANRLTPSRPAPVCSSSSYCSRPIRLAPPDSPSRRCRSASTRRLLPGDRLQWFHRSLDFPVVLMRCCPRVPRLTRL